MSWTSRYIGKPFADGGRGPEAFDCWGLVRQIYKDQLDIRLPTYSEVSSAHLIAVARRMAKPEDGPWEKVKRPAIYDVMVASAAYDRRLATHVGVMVDDRTVMHVWKSTNVCLMPLTHDFLGKRVLGIWRHKDLIC